MIEMGHISSVVGLIERQMMNGLLDEDEYNRSLMSLKTIYDYCLKNQPPANDQTPRHLPPQIFPTTRKWFPYSISKAKLEARDALITTELLKMEAMRTELALYQLKERQTSLASQTEVIS